MSFATDTAVVRVGPRCFTAELHDRWSSLVGIHGRYSAAIVVNAMTATVDDPPRALRSFAAQFAAAPRPEPVDIEVTVERAGRSMTTTSVRLRQEGRVLQVAHAVSSTPRPGLTYDEYVRPRDADPGDAPRFGPPGGPGHFQNADVRLDPDVIPFGGGDEALVAAWLRPLAGEPIDAAWLVAMCDVLPPAVFSRTTGPVKAATLEYLVHLATGEPAVAAGDHVYLSCRSPLSSDGFAPIPIWLGGYGDAAHERAARVGDGFIFGGRTEDVFSTWDRIRERVVQQGRPVEGFGGEYVIMSRKGPQEVAAKIAAWREAGGTHAAVLTMGLGLGSTDGHIEYLADIADVLGREPAGR